MVETMKELGKSEIIGLKINSDESYFKGATFQKGLWEMIREFQHKNWKLGKFKSKTFSVKGEMQYNKTRYCLFKIAEDFTVEDAREFSFGKTTPSVIMRKLIEYIDEEKI